MLDYIINSFTTPVINQPNQSVIPIIIGIITIAIGIWTYWKWKNE